jgi:hypothetical protein
MCLTTILDDIATAALFCDLMLNVFVVDCRHTDAQDLRNVYYMAHKISYILILSCPSTETKNVQKRLHSTLDCQR